MTFVEWLSMLGRGLRPWVTVKPWEQAVRVRAGRWVKILGAGMYVKFPILDSATVIPIRRRTIGACIQTLTSKDRQPVTIGVGLAYQVYDVLKVFQTIHNLEGTLATIAQGAVGRAVSDNDVVDITPALLAATIYAEINPSEKGLSEFEAFVTDLAVLPKRTFRLIQETRWTASATVDEMGREA